MLQGGSDLQVKSNSFFFSSTLQNYGISIVTKMLQILNTNYCVLVVSLTCEDFQTIGVEGLPALYVHQIENVQDQDFIDCAELFGTVTGFNENQILALLDVAKRPTVRIAYIILYNLICFVNLFFFENDIFLSKLSNAITTLNFTRFGTQFLHGHLTMSTMLAFWYRCSLLQRLDN